MSGAEQKEPDLSAVLSLDGKEATALKKAELCSLEGLLNYFPKRYEDRRSFDGVKVLNEGETVCLKGLILDFKQKGFGGRQQFAEAVFVIMGLEQTLNGRIGLRWFNMPYIRNLVAVGMELVVYGKLKDSRSGIVIDHPDFEVIESGVVGGVHMEQIVPVYKNIPGINQRRLREILWTACEELESARIRPFMHPEAPVDRADALRTVHFPQELDQVAAMRREFALEEVFLLQLNVMWQKSLIKAVPGYSQGRDLSLLKAFMQGLPFELTEAQKRSIREVIQDMKKPAPMHRLLQGDVGSGKTFVAMSAMLVAVEAGHQAVLMAPTQILAEQHYLTFQKWLKPLGVEIGLKTGAREEGGDDGAGGCVHPQILIGTHALLYEGADLDKVSLVVIDEQHRFGVEQRRQLIQKAQKAPDVLVMTATPIPRTLTLTLYGDLDVSLIDELPAGRRKIVSGVRQSPKVSDVTKFLKEHLSSGRQVYIVYPLVEESENLKAGAVVEEYQKWEKRLKPHGVGLLHGRLPAEEKACVMEQFREGELAVLVSTSVIEVGVDVPNATIMLIYDAERFGLAQLHQLRGRVGRGEHKSYCVLITSSKEEPALHKLNVLSNTENGFHLAEEDLTLRGPGELLGTAQSGAGNMRFLEYLTDLPLIKEAREKAERLLAADPALTQNRALIPYLK